MYLTNVCKREAGYEVYIERNADYESGRSLYIAICISGQKSFGTVRRKRRTGIKGGNTPVWKRPGIGLKSTPSGCECKDQYA